MKNLIKFDDVNNKIITIRNQNVILDSDVAALYNVETKEVNQAVKNNPDKFPEGYVFQLKVNEFHDLQSKFLTVDSELPDNQEEVKNFDLPLIISKFSNQTPRAFTEQGPYMDER